MNGNINLNEIAEKLLTDENGEQVLEECLRRVSTTEILDFLDSIDLLTNESKKISKEAIIKLIMCFLHNERKKTMGSNGSESGSGKSAKNRGGGRSNSNGGLESLPVIDVSKVKGTIAGKDPLDIAISSRNGEEVLKKTLENSDIADIRKTIREYQLDPLRLTTGWKRKDRIISHVMEVVHGRITDGAALRRN